MAMQNEILVGRYNQLLTRLLKVTGGAPSPQLTPEVTPVMVLISDAPDLAFIKQEQLMVVGVNSTGAAIGKQAYYQLANPVNSGLLITVEAFLIENATGLAQDYAYGVTTISTRAALAVSPRDSRVNTGLGNVQFGPGRFTLGSDAVLDGVAGIANRIGQVFLLSQTSIFLPVPYVLNPGDAFTVTPNGTNIIAAGTIFYRARPASTDETV
jgi:hypothetical protein